MKNGSALSNLMLNVKKLQGHWLLFIGAIVLGLWAAGWYIRFLDSGYCVPEQSTKIEIHLVEKKGTSKTAKDTKQGKETTKKESASPSYTVSAVKPVESGSRQKTSAEKKDSADGQPSEWMKKFLCEAKATDVAIVVFTYCLFMVAWFQAHYMRRQLVATEEAAIAASRQARYSIASELPVIAFAGQKLIGYDAQGKAIPALDPLPYGPVPPHMLRALVCLRNAGKSNAYVLRFSIRWKVAIELPPEPFYGHMAATNLVIEPNQMPWLVYEREPIVLSESERAAINANATTLWIYGFLAYADFMEDMHTIGFCYRWEVVPTIGDHPRGLVPDGPARYRYQEYHQKKGKGDAA